MKSSVEESSGDKIEVKKMSWGKRWGNNNNNNHKHSNFSNSHSFGNRPQHNKPQDSRQGKPWRQKGKDSKITLTQESAHFVPTEFSSSFFKQFDLADETEDGKNWENKKGYGTQVNEITERWFNSGLWCIQKIRWKRPAAMLGKNEKNQIIRKFHQPDYKRAME